jgi:hypothetical protein
MIRERFLGCSMLRNIWPITFIRLRCGSCPASKARHRPARPVHRSIQQCRTCFWRPRALGLGATLTTLLNFEKEVEAALGLPPNVHSYALLPIGYPIVRLSEDGVPATPAELMRHLQQWCEIQFAEQPADSTLKSKLRKLYAALRRPDEN